MTTMVTMMTINLKVIVMTTVMPPSCPQLLHAQGGDPVIRLERQRHTDLNMMMTMIMVVTMVIKTAKKLLLLTLKVMTMTTMMPSCRPQLLHAQGGDPALRLERQPHQCLPPALQLPGPLLLHGLPPTLRPTGQEQSLARIVRPHSR
jgi:hypothetical protein